MKKSVYIETTIISYLASRPSRDLIISGHQEITRNWWNNHLNRFDPVISEFVIQEASFGDHDASTRRMQLISDFPLLDLTEDVELLAAKFIKKAAIPKKKAIDAFHIAIATIHSINYLVTWNCAHIANAEMRDELIKISNQSGFVLPVICTPEELMGGEGL
ncbi:MAG: type II toxin-antitoxin system VapC family toxin [Chitinivibrionales bacterium]|nr:type II toxin-antitoxin system VapC family toxin [Chitinivibrionales bacterium]